MTKEQFIEQMTVIEDYLTARRKAGDVLTDTFFKESTPSVFDYGDDLLDLAVERLSELSGIDSDSIGWYASGRRGIHRYPYGFMMNIKTSADLWDFGRHNQHKR